MPSTARPNVIVFLTTQWRAQALGYAGDPNARTPSLDRLAANSIVFEQAVTPHPFGVFARAAFLTGLPCPKNGVREYYDPLPQDATTLAHRFGARGYQTAFFGKWQLYERDPDAPVVGEEHARIVVPPERRGGFDFWEGFESGFLLNDPLLHGTHIDEPRRFVGYQSDVLIDRFLAFKHARQDDVPLFAVLSVDAPHPPYAAAAAGVEAYKEDSIRLPKNVPLDPEIRAKALQELSGYYAHIEATDAALGRLVDSLMQGKAWKNTIFVFTSVHGDMHGSYGLFRKGWPYEESICVPLLLSWPEAFAEGRRDSMLISLLDLGPSLLGLCGKGQGEEAFSPMEGMDLSQSLIDQQKGPARQSISMPSVPPFPLQCPYAWTAKRDRDATRVTKFDGAAFKLDHGNEPR